MKQMLEKHGQDWTIEEAREFVNLYLKWISQPNLQQRLAKHFSRTISAIKIREQEVVRICGGEHEWPTVTPNMVQSVHEYMKENNRSANWMIMRFS